MNKEIAIFKANGCEYSMDIIDQKGDRWVPSQQVGEALGSTNIRKLIRLLRRNGELQEGKHICNLTLQMLNDAQPRKHLVLSYRGIIRTSMRSEGSRAPLFRDWAEDVLYAVMTTGRYERPDVVSEDNGRLSKDEILHLWHYVDDPSKYAGAILRHFGIAPEGSVPAQNQWPDIPL